MPIVDVCKGKTSDFILHYQENINQILRIKDIFHIGNATLNYTQ